MREAQLALSALHALPAHGEAVARTLKAICEQHELGEVAVVLEVWLARKGGELSPPQAYRR